MQRSRDKNLLVCVGELQVAGIVMYYVARGESRNVFRDSLHIASCMGLRDSEKGVEDFMLESPE